jgi:hypothetical protein
MAKVNTKHRMSYISANFDYIHTLNGYATRASCSCGKWALYPSRDQAYEAGRRHKVAPGEAFMAARVEEEWEEA